MVKYTKQDNLRKGHSALYVHANSNLITEPCIAVFNMLITRQLPQKPMINLISNFEV